MAVLISDTSILYGFIVSNHHDILVKSVGATYGHIEVPHQVDLELTRKVRQHSRRATTAYTWLKQKGHIKVYPAPTLGDLAIVQLATDLLEGVELGSHTKDAGEAACIAHAVDMRFRGQDVRLLLDDRRGREWAGRYSVPVVSSEWVFHQARRERLITSRSDMRRIYECVRRAPLGALPPLAATRLLDGLE